jgi:3-oxoadipate enol-lactonase
VEAVADTYGARYALGTSLGAGALGHLVARAPQRFEKLIFLLPAGLDRAFRYKDRMLRTAQLIEGRSKEEAIDAVLSDPSRVAGYIEYPWLRDFDSQMLQDLNPVGVPRAIREVIEDWPLADREDVRKVTAPTLLICREGDEIHPAEVGRILAKIMPNAELMMFGSGTEMYESLPQIVARVREFLLA